MGSLLVELTATARKLLFVHGVRFAALIGIGGGSVSSSRVSVGFSPSPWTLTTGQRLMA